jgi:Mn-dependent DtxR family transcriptional regulator
VRRRTDGLYANSLGPSEREAPRLIEERPGITVEELASEMGVGMKRAWQYLGRLDRRSFVSHQPS